MNNSFQHAMTYGLWLGWLFSCNAIASMFPVSSSIASFFVMFWQAVMLFAIVRYTLSSTLNYRFTLCAGRMRFVQGYTYIILLFFFASIISAGAKIVILKFMYPDYLAQLMQQIQNALAQPQFDKLQGKEDLLAQMQQILKPISYSLYWIWIDTFISFFVGLPLAWIASLKKWNVLNNNQPQNNQQQ